MTAITNTCRYAGRERPRMLTDRHEDHCTSVTCGGCLPCPERHCRVCGYTHVDWTCAECLADTREALRDIATRCNSLPAEVEHRGINGEAMMLLGPAADPEARGHLEASIAAGRVPAAPESDVSALWALSTPSLWESPDARSIPTLLAAIGQVLQQPSEAARERVRVVEGERDAANVHAIECERIAVEAIEARLMETARAESAEAAHEAERAAHAETERLRALWFGENSQAQANLANEKAAHEALRKGIEALVETFHARIGYTRSLVRGKTPSDKMNSREANVWTVAESDLRALLAGGES